MGLLNTAILRMLNAIAVVSSVIEKDKTLNISLRQR